ncbi:phosphoribosylformylglycinamidine synthase-like [Patiria miniata]|uniref:Phosphoribosylformylglycinamidine synthase n=1 Tax=Patiria miniata TaxID=46514 RepID=A0A913ZXJ5_PATMI|nr:phosphoribosylformylglycinamidine synthase-like [Patiria miniata]
MAVLHFYSSPGIQAGAAKACLDRVKSLLKDAGHVELKTEICYNVEVPDKDSLNKEDLQVLHWILATPFESNSLASKSFLGDEKSSEDDVIIEIGPRLNFSTAWSTNAVSMCQSAGLDQITRIECSLRYFLRATTADDAPMTIPPDVVKEITGSLHDRMTECRYAKPLDSFAIEVSPEPIFDVNVMGEGRKALEKANKELGLAFDDWDLEFYTDLFRNKAKRNPTSVECFDLAQSNSEHSRHWFFKGRMVVDQEEHPLSLFKMVMNTQATSNQNNVIKFSDNSSAIQGYRVQTLLPETPGIGASSFRKQEAERHIIFTAETHNFPTGVAPFSGATTGTGGRIRDVQAAGRGAHVVAGTAGYCFGNLHIPDYELPWEDTSFVYPSNMAPALQVAIQASNGASDYGNKFGEPVLTGFARSFGMLVGNGERREWVKPIMFSGGIGSLESGHVTKEQAEPGMKVVKLGGPVYRIGVGGGAASSIQVQGDNTEELDFGAVQRGDAEMEQKMNRVIRACIEMGEKNPICSIHDQGAGGNGNVLKEISEPAGALIRAKEFQLGDPTINTMELWGAEYQESNAILVPEGASKTLRDICCREKCSVSFVGDITGDGRIRLELEDDLVENGGVNGESTNKKMRSCSYPVDLELEWVLGSMPRKVFNMERVKPKLKPLDLPADLTVRDAINRVLRLPSVASKRYLTNKVDRSVTGLVAQQQCVGPLHTPLADVAVTALTHFDTVGSATAIGEQPIKGLVDPACGARMSVAEALTNLVFARVSSLKDVKCSGNWMWPAKLPGEGAALVDACVAMCDTMKQLGIAIDGGKDSLSMAARVAKETVKAPGALVISAYVGCPDIRATITPDLKCPGGCGSILFVDLSCGHSRLGGSALAQCYKQLGDSVPDLESTAVLVNAFNVTQELLAEGLLTAGHDVSDGGLITCLLEMTFAGNCGMEVNIPNNNKASSLELLFAEELGLVFEVSAQNAEAVCQRYAGKSVLCSVIGQSCGQGPDSMVRVSVDGSDVLTDKMTVLRDAWEETSFRLEALQANPECVTEERLGLGQRVAPPYKLTFDPNKHKIDAELAKPGFVRPKVAVIREEGSNGDREMVASLFAAGFDVWDVNMHDLATGNVTLDRFRGVVFVGGFSYADVCGSAKGWAAAILFNPTVRAQFDAFRARSDTFSLGVCNGCQLMGLLGWVAPDHGQGMPDADSASSKQGVFLTHNKSERFESRFVSVGISQSPSILLQGMEGSVLGIWVAHGEGQMKFASDAILDQVTQNNLAPIRYVDDQGQPTTQYPLNPNGSPEGVAALCSPDGRHFALMPHPERCTFTWQWAWIPQEWQREVKVSPWMHMFKNACAWCHQNA